MQNTNSSSLSRIWRHNQAHDCGAITAFRQYKGCDTEEVYSSSDNQKRNKSLVAHLISRGYGVTKLEGRYPEGGKETKEISFFVVDLKDHGNLENDLLELGHKFEQDSILFVPKGAIDNKAEAVLIGTNSYPNNMLAGHARMPFNLAKLGDQSPIYTSFVNGRPFYFTSASNGDLQSYQNGIGLAFAQAIASKNWSDLEQGEQDIHVTYTPNGMKLFLLDGDTIEIAFYTNQGDPKDWTMIRSFLDRVLEEEIKSGKFGADIPHPISEEELNAFKRVAEIQNSSKDTK